MNTETPFHPGDIVTDVDTDRDPNLYCVDSCRLVDSIRGDGPFWLVKVTDITAWYRGCFGSAEHFKLVRGCDERRV